MRSALRIVTLLLAVLALTAQAPVQSFTATTDNVSGAGESIRMDVLRWSTDSERDQLLAAWNMTAPAAGTRAARPAPEEDLFAAGNDAPVGGQAKGAGRAAGKGAGKAFAKGGGKGGGKGGANAPKPTPEGTLKAALGSAPAVGRVWTSEVSGYSVRYAARFPEADGGERIILLTDRRLGAWNDLWKPTTPGVVTPYEFSLIELHVSSKGEGEGKVSQAGKVAVDGTAKTLALENYSGLPVMLKNVRRK